MLAPAAVEPPPGLARALVLAALVPAASLLQPRAPPLRSPLLDMEPLALAALVPAASLLQPRAPPLRSLVLDKEPQALAACLVPHRAAPQACLTTSLARR